MANTTWNASDKSANVTLSGSNLIATSSGASGWVRAADRQYSGKFYFELKPTTWVNSSTSVGFGVVSTTPAAAASGFIFLNRTGNITVDGVTVISSMGTRASNDVIGIAVDLSAQLCWFRVAPTGNWNASSAANPATGDGGITISTLGGLLSISAYPVGLLNANAESITANFGDSAFSGSVPSGFTGGWTSGVAAPSTINVYSAGLAREALISGTGAARLSTIAREALISGTGFTGRTQGRSSGRPNPTVVFAGVILAASATAKSKTRAAASLAITLRGRGAATSTSRAQRTSTTILRGRIKANSDANLIQPGVTVLTAWAGASSRLAGNASVGIPVRTKQFAVSLVG